MSVIKKIKVNGVDYNLGASCWLDTNGNEHDFSELLGLHYEVVWSDEDYKSSTVDPSKLDTIGNLKYVPKWVECYYDNGTKTKTGARLPKQSDDSTIILIYQGKTGLNSYAEYICYEVSDKLVPEYHANQGGLWDATGYTHTINGVQYISQSPTLEDWNSELVLATDVDISHGDVTVTNPNGTTVYRYQEYDWEKIGDTDVDLSNYVQKGVYHTGNPSTNVTSSAGGQTITSSTVSAYTATGSASVTYKKSATETGSKGDHTHTISVLLPTANKTVLNGLNTASLTYVNGVADGGTATVATGVQSNGTATALTGVKVSATTAVNNNAIKNVTLSASDTTADGPTYVQSISYTTPTLEGETTFNTDAIKSVSLSASSTTADGPTFVQSVSYTKQTLGGTTSFNTNGIKSVTLEANDTLDNGITFVQGISYTAPSLTGTKTFNTDAIKAVSLSASATTADGPTYVQSVSYTKQTLTGTTVFNTNAIKSVSLSASSTTADGPTYVQSISYTAPSLTGTKTFVTGYSNFSGGSVTNPTPNYGFGNTVNSIMYGATVSNTGVLSWSTVTAGTSPTFTFTAASLGTASTGTINFDSGSLTKTTKQMKVTTTAAGTGTVQISDGGVTATTKYMKVTPTAASTATVGIDNGSVTATTKYMHTNSTAADSSSVTISDGAVTATKKYMKASGTAASTGTVGITGGAVTATTKYMKKTTTAADTTNVAISVGSNGTATVLTGVTVSGTATVIKSNGLSTATATFATSGITTSVAGPYGDTPTTFTTSSTGAHTHSITLSDATANGSASAAITAHSHTVTVSAHTHDLSNHTHNITLNTPDYGLNG